MCAYLLSLELKKKTNNVTTEEEVELRVTGDLDVTTEEVHFSRGLVGDGTIKLKYGTTKEMVADILTKGVAREQLCYLHQKAGMESLE